MKRSKPSKFKLEIEPDDSRKQANAAVEIKGDWQMCLDGEDTFIEEEIEDTLDEKWRDFGEGNETHMDHEFSLDEPIQSDDSDTSDSNIEYAGKSINVISHDLGERINLQIPSQFSQKIINIKAKQLDVISRNEVIGNMCVGNEEKYCSDIYELFDCMRKTKRNLNNGKVDVISVPKQFLKHTKISIHIGSLENIECYTFYAYVYTKAKWVKIGGEMSQVLYQQNSNVVTFHANTLSKFFITYSPKVEEAVLNPHEEYEYVSCHDSRTRVVFPQDCVEKSERVYFMVIPGDVQGMCWRRENNPKDYNVRAISHCLYVKHDVRRFLKQVSLSLPINEEQDDCDLVFFRKKGDSIEVLDLSKNDTISKNGDCGSIDVSGFSRLQAARIKSGSASHVSNLEVELSMGLKKVCAILLFMKKDKDNFLTLWIEITTKENGPKVAEKRKSMGFCEVHDCRSGDIFLKDASRIRIDIKGCIKPLKGFPKAFFFLTFLTLSEDNHLSFPVQLYQQLSDHPYAIISFTESVKSKTVLHVASFVPAPKSVPKLNLPRKDNHINTRPKQIQSSRIARSQTFSGFNTETFSQDKTNDLKDSKEKLLVKKKAWVDSARKSKQKTRSVDEISDDGDDIQMSSERSLFYSRIPQEDISEKAKSRKKGNSSLSKTWSSNFFHDQYGEDSSEEDSSSNVNYYPTAKTGIEAFFSDKSMGKLAQRLTADECYKLAIELGLNRTEIDHIKGSSPNIVEINLKMIQKGLSRINRKERLDNLVEALYEIEMRNLAQIVEKVANVGRGLINNDFERSIAD